ncbi:MAG: hypothetical protein ACI9X4_002621, partial [Glaciecola sp.]
MLCRLKKPFQSEEKRKYSINVALGHPLQQHRRQSALVACLALQLGDDV